MERRKWQHRVGVQTIIWGEEFAEGLDATLEKVKRLGFAGVEFAQVPARLGSPSEFERLMRRHKLHFLGLAGGSLRARLDFCDRMAIRPDYLYVQKWEDPIASEALAKGYVLALHPHHLSRIDTAARAAHEFVDRPEDRFLLLPDTAHLFLGGDDFTSVMELNRSRIKVVHLKDWTPEFGWSLFTYARGFTELGAGVVPLSEIWEKLRGWLVEKEDRWVVVEQDHTHRNVWQSLEISREWLRARKTAEAERPTAINECRDAPTMFGPVPKDARPPNRADPIEQRNTSLLLKIENFLQRITVDSFRSVDHLYDTILEGLAAFVDIKCATLWEINPTNEKAILRSFWRPRTEARRYPKLRVIDLQTALSGMAVEERAVKYFTSVRAGAQGRIFADVDFIRDFHLEGMVSVPISNHWNINQPELLVNLFPTNPYDVLSPEWLSGAMPHLPMATPQLQPLFDGEDLHPNFVAAIQRLKEVIAISVERAWQQIRSEVASEVTWIACRNRSANAFLNALPEPIGRRVESDKVQIFLVNPSGLALHLRAPLTLDVPFEFSLAENPLATTAWRERSVQNLQLPGGTEGSARFCLCMPIYAQNLPLEREILGVMVCEKAERSDSVSQGFTLTDEIILDAFQASMAPFLERMLAVEARTVTMRRITHELKGPLTVFRGASKYALKEIQSKRYKFSEDYIGHMRSYIVLMEQIVAKAGFLRIEEGVRLAKSRVLLFEDIIAPAVAGLDDALEARGFRKENICLDRIKDTRHALYVDKLRFQQVVFNLLTNSIKYGMSDPRLFKVEIHAEQHGGSVRLIFRDNGTGIPELMKESIFKEGIRGPNADELNAAGDGLGLWMVREIVRAHGGSIAVTRCMGPTEFTIDLPANLAEPIFGSFLFARPDILKPENLASRLMARGDEACEHLYSRMAEATRDALVAWGGTGDVGLALKECLIEELNRVVIGPSLLDLEVFHSRCRDIDALLPRMKGYSYEENSRINRLVLQGLFPDELARPRYYDKQPK